MTDSTIREDVPAETSEDEGYSLEGAAEALLKRYRDARQPSQPATKDETPSTPEPTETPEEDDGETEETSDQEPEESPEDPESAPAEAGDDHIVKVKVDGEEKQVSVKDLKRLWGQEAALTRKSQEVATLRKQVEDEAQKYNLGLQKLVEKAKARWEPYSQVDFLVAAKSLDVEQLSALRKDAKEAYEDYAYLTQELDGARQKTQQEAQTRLASSAQECLKQLQSPDSPYHIPEWSSDLYGDLRGFAVRHGIPQEAIDVETTPAAFKILHMALQFEKAQKVATKKIAKASPKKTVSSKEVANSEDDGAASLKRKFASSGSVDDAAALLLHKFRSRKS